MSKASAAAITSSSQTSSCTTATAIREQARLHSPGVILPEHNISADFLQQLLAKFKVEAVIEEDGDLKISEAFGLAVYIRLEPKRHWIIFHTGFETPTLDDEDRTGFAQDLSLDLAMAQFAATDHGIGMSYFMYYRGGLSVDQFMAMAQRFGSLACAAMRRYTVFDARSEHEAGEPGQVVTLN